MLRIILVVVVALLAAAGGFALALHHYFGWKGLLAFPVLLAGFVWLGKIAIGRLIKRFFLRLAGIKAGVLRGASMTVHSVVPLSQPPEQEIADGDEDLDDEDEAENEPEHKPEDDKPRVYYEVDVTITPAHRNDDAVWEPTELILTSQPVTNLEDLEENEVGTTHDCLLWNGSTFARR